MSRPPLPPFRFEATTDKVRMAENAWNSHELDYRLIKELWALREKRIALRFSYEWHNNGGPWVRSGGNENRACDVQGLMHTRVASINNLPITEAERKFLWPAGPRPGGHATLAELRL